MLALAPPALAGYRLHAPTGADQVPPGFAVSAGQAFAAAERTQGVQQAARHVGRMSGAVFYTSDRKWRVQYSSPRAGDQVEVEVDGRTGNVLHVWSGARLADLARGGQSRLAHHHVASPVVMALLAVLFLLPFVDPRRPFRRLHLDLAILVAFVVPFELWKQQQLALSLAVVVGLLVLLIARLALSRAGRVDDDGPLVPFLSVRGLTAAVLVLFAARAGFNLLDPETSDIGVGTLGGADRILHGLELYSRGGSDFDTYGPAAYLLYTPFAALWPLESLNAYNPAGVHAAALFFDTATAGALVFAGRRLVAGEEGRLVGLAAAWAWFAYPFTTLALAINANDVLVSVTVLLAILSLSSPARTGVAAAVAGMTKFAPLALVPLLAAACSGRRPRRLSLFAGAFVVTAGVLLAVTLPDGGLREFYDTTIGYQGNRSSPLSLWYHLGAPALQTATMILVAGFLVALYLVPRAPGRVRVCALGGAALAATQLPLDYWFFTYLVWPLPLVLLALFARAER